MIPSIGLCALLKRYRLCCRLLSSWPQGDRARCHRPFRKVQGALKRPFSLLRPSLASLPQQQLPDRQHMASFGQQLVVTHLAGDLREIEAMAEVADLQIGVFQPLRLL